MEPATAASVRDAIREIVELQLRQGAPPEVGPNLDRLIAAGFLREEAMTLIGCVLSRELSHALESGLPFDAQRYLDGLAALPAMRWD